MTVCCTGISLQYSSPTTRNEYRWLSFEWNPSILVQAEREVEVLETLGGSAFEQVIECSLRSENEG